MPQAAGCAGNIDRQTDKKWTNEETEVDRFPNQPGYDDLTVKFEFDWTNNFFEQESRNENVDPQTDGQSYTNFESNLAMMVIYLPVKFEFDWTKYF